VAILAALVSALSIAAPSLSLARPAFIADFYEYATDGAAHLAAADINGDGHVDFVTANPDSHTYSVFLGDGEGTFLPRTDHPASGSPVYPTLGFLDGDAHLDLVLRATGLVWVFLGVGDGTFGPGTSYPAGSAAGSPAIGDVDGDGNPDVVVVNFSTSSGTFSVLRGNGDGTLQPKIDHPTAAYTSQVFLADLNSNGILDVVVSGQVGTPPVMVFLGTGGGGFAAPASYAMNETFSTLGDLNGDGRLDLVSSGYGGHSPGTTLNVRLGNADGTFGNMTTFATAPLPSELLVADMTGDGRADVVVRCGSVVSVLPGDGNGGLGGHIDSPGNQSCPMGLIVADMDEDGYLDAATGTYCGGVAVLLGNNNGTFGRTTHISGVVDYINSTSQALAVGDINEDGHLDAAVCGGYEVALLNGYGLTGFTGQRKLPAPNKSLSVVLGDLDLDGHLDMIGGSNLPSTGGKVTVRHGNGDGTFGAPTDYALPNVLGSGYHVVTGDVDGDGVLDLAATGGTLHGLSVLLGNGDGTFGPRHDVSNGNFPNSIACADVNGDQLADLVFTDYNSNTLSLVMSVGGGDFDQKIDFTVPAGPVTIGDLNGDSRPDIASAWNSASKAGVTILFQDLNEVFGPPQTFPLGIGGISPYSIKIADVNGDSRPDLVVTGGNKVTVLLGHGDGTFDDSRAFGVHGSAVETGIGDWSGDGLPELVVVSYDIGRVSVLYNQTAAAYPVGVPVRAPTTAFRLLAPRPNPSPAGVTLDYVLPRAVRTTVAVYDPTGRRVRVLANGHLMTAGPHTASWDGRRDDGALARPGVYWLAVATEGERAARRFVIVR
jgi:hypothetical protein